MGESRTQASHLTSELSLKQGNLSDDLLQGAGAIAEFMFGNARKRRQVYHLAQTTCLPVFKLGATLCARRSTLLAYIEAQETQANP